jgi:hypothetical protein
MPVRFSWVTSQNGGNCLYGGEVDAQGKIEGSSGCEASAQSWAPRTLAPDRRVRFIAALDRLRSSSLPEVDGASRHCGEGLSLRLNESTGRSRGWDFCDKSPIPSQVANVLEELSER